MGQQIGSDYITANKPLTVRVNTESWAYTDLNTALDLPSDLVGGFLSMEASQMVKEKLPN